jgi:hypothetical protein
MPSPYLQFPDHKKKFHTKSVGIFKSITIPHFKNEENHATIITSKIKVHNVNVQTQATI